MCQEKFRRVSFGTGPARADLTKAHLFLLTHRAGYGTITEYPRIQVSGNPRSSLCLPLRMQRLAPPRVPSPCKNRGFLPECGHDGIGRHARFRFSCFRRWGSSPHARTITLEQGFLLKNLALKLLETKLK